MTTNTNDANNVNNEINAVILCPHCNSFVFIEKINCAIFRHGAFKINGNQIPPHSSKERCDALVRSGVIHGCGKPFKVVFDANGTLVAEPCGYI
jgi:hypothetical protein